LAGIAAEALTELTSQDVKRGGLIDCHVFTIIVDPGYCWIDLFTGFRKGNKQCETGVSSFE